jgi:hypothetical protein
MITWNQIPYFAPPVFDQTVWQYPGPEAVQREPSLLETILKGAGTVLLVGAAGVAVYAVCDALFGSNEPVHHCSECGSTGHDARNCPMTGLRTRLRIEKIGICACCKGRFRYTELHHYAGRGVERGKEMCGPCHLWCGHDGDWQSYPINPRYCRLTA